MIFELRALGSCVLTMKARDLSVLSVDIREYFRFEVNRASVRHSCYEKRHGDFKGKQECMMVTGRSHRLPVFSTRVRSRFVQTPNTGTRTFVLFFFWDTRIDISHSSESAYIRSIGSTIPKSEVVDNLGLNERRRELGSADNVDSDGTSLEQA